MNTFWQACRAVISSALAALEVRTFFSKSFNEHYKSCEVNQSVMHSICFNRTECELSCDNT